MMHVAFTIGLMFQVVPVKCGNFLEAQDRGYVSMEEIDFLLQVENSSSNLPRIEEELNPLYIAMPKNKHGRLEPAVVRYTLHRYFAEKYAWHFRGLESGGGSWNASASTLSGVMKDKVPSYIESLLQKNFQTQQGLGLKELAVFAAALLDLVHREALEDLEEYLSLWQIPQSGRVSPNDAKQILKMHLMVSMKGFERKSSLKRDYQMLEQELTDRCFAWTDAQLWLADMRKSAEVMFRSHHNPFLPGMTFDELVEVAHLMAGFFGKFQNLECHTMKDRLIEMEDGGTGRVPLNKFYSGVDDPKWPFYETVGYLRSLGALDESNPKVPSVIIPNYLGSYTFCANPSQFYSVCCIDECESLMAHVERSVMDPVALPAQIVDVISHLESDTVAAPRNLSSLQIARLNQIADLHGGAVPLHGRLFAQWMHHAYPRECRFPHIAGTTKPMSQEEFSRTEINFEATDEEMQSHIDNEDYLHVQSLEISDEAKQEAIPWSFTEELVGNHASTTGQSRSLSRVLLLVAAFVCVTFPAWRASSTLWATTVGQSSGKDINFV